MANLLCLADSDPAGPKAGGIETYIRELLPRLAQNHEVHLLAPENTSSMPRIHKHDFNNIKIRLIDTLSFFTLLTIKTTQICRKNDIDIVIPTNTFPTGIAAVINKKLTSTPILQSIQVSLEHTRGTKRTRELLNGIAIKNANRIHIPNASLKKTIEKKYQRRNVTVIPNGVDTEEFNPKKQYKTNDILNIICVAHYRPPQKRQDILIEAVKDLDGVQLTLIGSDMDQLENNCDIPNNVTLQQPIPHSELSKRLQEADIFALPSTYEGQPIAALEAMSCGLPIIGTEIAGLIQIVEENGKLTELNAESFKSVIEEAKSWNLEEMGKESRKIAKTHSWDNIADSFESIIQETL